MRNLSHSQKKKWIYVDENREDVKHRTEWCAAASKYRCMKCGRCSKANVLGSKCLSKNLGRWEKATYGRARCGKKNGQAGRSFDLVQNMLGLRTTENGTLTDDCCKLEPSGYQRVRQDVKTISDSRRRQGPCSKRQITGRLMDK